jgi:hypothetical protein
MNVPFSDNHPGGHSSSQHANCTLPQLDCKFQWTFIVPSSRCTLVMIMLFNQLLDMPHLSGGWIILAKEKCSLTHLREGSFLWVWNISGIFYLLCFIFLFSVLRPHTHTHTHTRALSSLSSVHHTYILHIVYTLVMHIFIHV